MKVDKVVRFPLMVRMNGARVLFVGGGKVSERKINALLHTGPKVTVISPSLSDGIKKWVDEGAVIWKEGEFNKKMVYGEIDFAFVATNDSFVNAEAAKHFKDLGLPVNVADSPHDCDFHMPAVLFEEGYVISVSTDGQSPDRARKIKEKIAEFIQNGGLKDI